ncbi:STAS domain-containing protein [Novosphingobium sp. PhB165]|uniref:STAS domain-containing protein n=1 Tax=Novosphingobium sp. PhB165 TaxID=2485105 RepID=UPI0010480A17|nr:STAS domain-containing protein [Novosphingobium sp. PhB165]TCM17715.1 STAS domain-containing protein [Novosphingobium sp. PhB165]
MPSLPEGTSGEGPLALSTHASTVTAEELRDRLVATIGAIEIDAANVESVGQAVLQLLLAARNEADATGRPFAIVNPSQPFVDRVRACGLAAPLGLVEEEFPA